MEKHLSREPQKSDAPEPEVDVKNTQVEVLMQSCSNILTRKRLDDATMELRKAMTLDPENKMIAKQVWAIHHPDKFYAGAIDKEWQKAQPPVKPA